MNKEEIKLYKDLLNDTKEQLAYEIIQKNRELDKLEDVIYKAIEYIDIVLLGNKESKDEWWYKTYSQELLEILKGGENENN